jgi:hypothetical protein
MRYRGALPIAAGVLALVAIAAAPTYTGVLLSGSSSGVVTIQPGAAAAGTWNFNLPTTAGSSGAPLLSGGGAAAAMTWGSALGTAAASNTGTSGATVPLLNGTNTWSAAQTVIGLNLSGSSSGVVTIQPGAAAAGTYNFNLPTTAGSSGAPLLSGGGGSTAMSWGSALGTAAASNTGTSGGTVPLLNGTNTWSATQTVAAIASTPQVLTYAATVTPDLSASNYFTVTLTGNVTLASPSNQHTGQSGCIAVTQDATGSRTISFGGNWKFAGGIAPTLTTTANAIDDVCYWVVSAGVVHGTFIPNVQ